MSSTPSPIDPASMDAASRRRITAALSTGGEGGLCAACALLLGVSGAAIAVVSEEGHRGVLCSSNAAAGALEDLQITLGEGPGIDADRLGVPVTDDDLAASGSSRWLAFCAPAVDARAAAVFAFPLRLGGIQPGTLTFNNHCAGPLSDGKYAAADLAAISLCQVRATRDARLVTEQLQHALQSRIAIEQAKGMLAERGAIAMDEAFPPPRLCPWLPAAAGRRGRGRGVGRRGPRHRHLRIAHLRIWPERREDAIDLSGKRSTAVPDPDSVVSPFGDARSGVSGVSESSEPEHAARPRQHPRGP